MFIKALSSVSCPLSSSRGHLNQFNRPLKNLNPDNKVDLLVLRFGTEEIEMKELERQKIKEPDLQYVKQFLQAYEEEKKQNPDSLDQNIISNFTDSSSDSCLPDRLLQDYLKLYKEKYRFREVNGLNEIYNKHHSEPES